MKVICKITICVICVIFLASCSSDNMACEDIMLRLCSELELPVGESYCGGNDGTDLRAMSLDTIRTMYGREGEEVFSLLEEYAIYLSAHGRPYEVAVFKCHSSSDSNRVISLCLERADTLNVLTRDTEYAEVCGKARVISKGKYTVMVIAPEAERGEELAKRLLF